MDTQLKQFEKIWNMYSAIIDMNDYEFDKYIKIIHKIRQNDFDFSKCKDDFIELINIAYITICYDKYGMEEPDTNDIDLKCCDTLKHFIKNC